MTSKSVGSNEIHLWRPKSPKSTKNIPKLGASKNSQFTFNSVKTIITTIAEFGHSTHSVRNASRSLCGYRYDSLIPLTFLIRLLIFLTRLLTQTGINRAHIFNKVFSIIRDTKRSTSFISIQKVDHAFELIFIKNKKSYAQP